MPDTHINAYFADVEEAKREVSNAQAKLGEAEDRLAAKKLEVGYTDPVPKQETEQAADNEWKKKAVPQLDNNIPYRKK
jgi:hypothetical protein